MRNRNRLYGRNSYIQSKRTRQISGANIRPCPGMTEYIGNVFLLGLATLAGEVIDLQAANALNVLLMPFQNQQNEQNGDETQEILSGDVEDTDIIDLLDGLV